MKNNTLKKVIAATLAGTMILGSTTMVFADSAKDITGSGSVDGLVDKDIVVVEVPTSEELKGRFDFILDPQGLIAKSVATSTAKEGYNSTTFPAAKANSLYFANVETPGTAAVEAKDASAVAKSIASVTDAAVLATLKVTVPAATTLSGDLTYRTTEDKWGGVSGTAYSAAGWYKVSGEDEAESEPEGIAATNVTIKNNTDDVAVAKNDVITVTAKVDASEATAATYTHSGTSDAITAINKGFVDANISISLAMDGLGTKISMTGDNTFANDVNPSIYLAIQGGASTEGTAPAANALSTQAIPTGKNGTYLFGVTTKNAWNDFNAKYEDGAYSMVPKDATVKYKTYDFKLTGKANEAGAWTVDLKTATPSVKVVWDFSKKGDATVAMTDEGAITISGLTKNANFASYTFYGEDGLVVASPKKTEVNISTTNSSGETTWTSEEGGTLTAQLTDALRTAWKDTKVTVVVTLSDGSTVVAANTIKAPTANSSNSGT